MIKLRLKFTVDIEVHNIFMVHKPSLSIKKKPKKTKKNPHTHKQLGALQSTRENIKSFKISRPPTSFSSNSHSSHSYFFS